MKYKFVAFYIFSSFKTMVENKPWATIKFFEVGKGVSLTQHTPNTPMQELFLKFGIKRTLPRHSDSKSYSRIQSLS